MTQRNPVARRAASRAYAEYVMEGYGLLIGYGKEDVLSELARVIDETVGRFCEGPGTEQDAKEGEG